MFDVVLGVSGTRVLFILSWNVRYFLWMKWYADLFDFDIYKTFGKEEGYTGFIVRRLNEAE